MYFPRTLPWRSDRMFWADMKTFLQPQSSENKYPSLRIQNKETEHLKQFTFFNDIQHIDTQDKGLIYDTQHKQHSA